MKPDYADLIARLEAASGPDRELDAAIWQAFGGEVVPVTEVGGHKHKRWIDDERVRWMADATTFTASIDAAVALVEKALPGWTGGVQWFPGTELLNPDGAQAFLMKGKEYQSGEGHSAPLAILIALLHAKDSSDDA